ncbi:MAG: hypothetical protein ACAI25_04100 [Planctomycetota bacterium]
MRPRVVLVVLLLTSTALAGDPLDLAEKDPRVTGHTYFGAYVGRKSLGFMEVDIAPTTSGAASYHARAVARAALADERVTIAEKGLLDRKLCAVPLDHYQGEGAAADDPPLVLRFEKVGDLYFFTKNGKKTEVGASRPVVHGFAAQLAYLRALDATKKGTYRVCELDVETSEMREVEFEVTGEAPVVEERKLREVLRRFVKTKETARFLLDPDAPPARRVVRWRNLDQEIEYVLAADEAGAKKDLPPPPRPKDGSPRAAILAYLEAVEKRDAKKLEPLLDWASFQRSLGEKGDLEKWKKSFLEQMASREEHDDHGEHARAEDLIPRLIEETTSPEALDARVRIEGEKGVFRLVRDKPGAPWKISQLPD